MSPPVSKSHPHLYGALTRLITARGDCFWRAAGFVLDEPTAVLCLGIFRAGTEEEIAANPEVSTVPFYHCWCEFRGGVVAPTTIERTGMALRIMDAQSYYGINGASDIRRMPRPQLLAISRRIGLARMLLGRQPNTTEPLSTALLDALGFDWGIKTGGMVPAEYGEKP